MFDNHTSRLLVKYFDALQSGIRIGDIKTGWLKAFIPDDEATRGAGTEFLGVDNNGTIYSGASGRPGLVVHELFRPLD